MFLSDQTTAGEVKDLLQSDAAFAVEMSNALKIARQLCAAPFSSLVFAEEDSWTLICLNGGGTVSVPADSAGCLNELRGSQSITFKDLSGQQRFKTDNSVLAAVRSMSGVALMSGENSAWGYVCVLDSTPEAFSPTHAEGLALVGQQVQALTRLHLLNRDKNAGQLFNIETEIRNIFRNTIDAVIVTCSDGYIMHWNRRAEYLLGWKAEEVIDLHFETNIIPERFKQKHRNEVDRHRDILSELTVDKTIEITALRKDNTELDIALGVSPAIIHGKRVFINYIRDITERKLAMERLDKQKEFYENILNKLPADIVVFDPNHRYLFVNPGGIKNEEFRKFIIGKDDFEYAAYRKRDSSIAQLRRDQFLEVKKDRKEIKWEDSLPDPDGVKRTHLRRLFPILDENNEVSMVIGFGIEITDRKNMEEKQAALVKQLSAQNVQLTDFCNIVSHNLRGPLVNMSILVKFIEESEDEEERTLLISRLNPVIDNLNTTFNELVESIQIKQDLEVISERLEMRTYLQRVLNELEYEINNSDAIIYVNIDETPVVYYPSKYLQSILHNLVSNSLKYRSPDRKPIIRIEAKRKGGSVVLSVEDNGLGIDLVKHKENFFKIGKVFHRHPNAKGFGLFMTKTQVEAMNGNIWVESAVDKGSTFFVEFINQYAR
jgi:PAS domain S-box-containing protein